MKETKITIRLPQNVAVGMTHYAEAREMEPAKAIEAIVREAVKDLVGTEMRCQIDAETVLMEFVDNTIRGWRDAGQWNKHVTGELFKRIKAEKLSTYAEAIDGEPLAFGNPEKARINRHIGSRVKRLLHADLILSADGRRETHQPARTENALVLGYSLLQPSS